jgi:hypothetical protein
MMDMRKYSGQTFIKVADVRNGPLRMQIAAVREGKYEKPDLVFESGEALSVNSTNNRTLMRAFGSDSNEWVRKYVELALGQIKYQGAWQDAVIVTPISLSGKNQAANKGMAEDGLQDNILF